MRAVPRDAVAAPRALTEPTGRGAKELAALRDWRANPATAAQGFAFAAYKDDSVKAALEALFHGKCAYCETYYSAQAPVDVEHFRPKGAVEDAPDHPGYWWLAMAWDNLLPACIDCNRRRKQPTPKPSSSLAALHDLATQVINTGKKDAFPVAGSRAPDETASLDLEQPYLLDPCHDRPEDHLAYHLDPDDLIALVLPRAGPGANAAPGAAVPALGDAPAIAAAAQAQGVSVRGAVSIQLYGLNRLGLVQARTRALRHLEFLRGLIAEIDAIARRLETSAEADIRAAAPKLDQLIDRILAQIAAMAAPEAPYSAMVSDWTRRFMEDIT